MSNRAYPIEHFDGLRSTDPEVREHIDFVRRMDAVALLHGDRSYVIPWRCPGCLRIVAAHEVALALAGKGQ